jgi:hypothetical protein
MQGFLDHMRTVLETTPATSFVFSVEEIAAILPGFEGDRKSVNELAAFVTEELSLAGGVEIFIPITSQVPMDVDAITQHELLQIILILARTRADYLNARADVTARFLASHDDTVIDQTLMLLPQALLKVLLDSAMEWLKTNRSGTLVPPDLNDDTVQQIANHLTKHDVLAAPLKLETANLVQYNVIIAWSQNDMDEAMNLFRQQLDEEPNIPVTMTILKPN